MERLTPQQRLQIAQLYYENQRSVRNVFRAPRPFYGRHNRPTEPTIRNTIAKIENQFSLLDDTQPSRPHPPVWCGLWAGGIIGPYFFKNDDGRNVTVNGARYCAMISNESSKIGASEWTT